MIFIKIIALIKLDDWEKSCIKELQDLNSCNTSNVRYVSSIWNYNMNHYLLALGIAQGKVRKSWYFRKFLFFIIINILMVFTRIRMVITNNACFHSGNALFRGKSQDQL